MQDEGKGSGNVKILERSVSGGILLNTRRRRLLSREPAVWIGTWETLVRSWSRQHHSMSAENWEDSLLSSANDFRAFADGMRI